MKLFIQIPCYNEKDSLSKVLEGIPKKIEGVDEIKVLVIDDGSTDGTADLALSLGVDGVVGHRENRGLAAAFQTGIDACLKRGADLIVNMDGDNQYPGDQIQRLIQPILDGQADMVIGDRQTGTLDHFSPLKKLLQRWGSLVVRMSSGTDVPDATSGFRAFSRDAAMRFSIFTRYTYTLETIIQAKKKGISVANVPIRVEATQRPSRLMKNSLSYVLRSAASIVRVYALYEPFRIFVYTSLPFFGVGTLFLGRFLFLFCLGERGVGRFVQSVVAGSTAVILGLVFVAIGIIADSVAANRKVTEQMHLRLKRQELNDSRAEADNRQEAPER